MTFNQCLWYGARTFTAHFPFSERPIFLRIDTNKDSLFRHTFYKEEEKAPDPFTKIFGERLVKIPCPKTERPLISVGIYIWELTVTVVEPEGAKR